MKENCNSDYRNLKSPISIEDPSDIPANEILELVFAGARDVLIRNGHCGLSIPSQTLDEIKHLPPSDKTKVVAKMSQAIKDSSEIVLIPKKRYDKSGK